MLIPGKVNVVIDGQWGSTGKGKLAGHIAKRSSVQVVICDFQSNAGHTFVEDGIKHVVHQIPSGFVNRDAVLAINPAASITVGLLLGEIERFADYKIADRLVIHPNACIITDEHVAREREQVRFLASTMKGCGAALADKTMRKAKLAREEPRLERWLGDTSTLVQNALRTGGTVLAESSQGFDLSLNHGYVYPFVTSRDVTTCAVLSACGVPPSAVGRVWGCLRTFPIRVGHVYEEDSIVGNSGGFHTDQRELTWSELQALSGSSESLVELTTVTQRVRRVFTWSDIQFKRFLRTCGPSDLFINFINHIRAEDTHARTPYGLTYETKAWLKARTHTLEETQLPTHCRISLLGTGPDDQDMVQWA